MIGGTANNKFKARKSWTPAVGFAYGQVLLYGPENLSFNWWEDALEFDVYNSKSILLRLMVDAIYNEIASVIKVQSPSRTKEVIKNVLINLWCSRLMDRPVRYSRDRNWYSSHRRYGKLFLKYERIIPVIDALEILGYIAQKAGISIPDKNFGRQTRMWGTYKLWSRFSDFDLMQTQTFFSKPEPEELIILHKEVKKKSKKTGKVKKYQVPIGYTETRQTRKWREQQQVINDYTSRQVISVKLDGKIVVNKYFLIQYLYSNILNGDIKLGTVSTSNSSAVYKNNTYIQLNSNPTITRLLSSYNSPSHIYQNNTIPLHKLQTTMTQMKQPRHLIPVLIHDSAQKGAGLLGYIFNVRSEVAEATTEAERQAILNEEFRLEDIGIQELTFTLNRERLHRVFNRASFKKGGRAYGALHQNLPKQMRQYIYINGSRTVEVDYSAYHILMLYHREGIDYTDDPYRACGGDDMRKLFKIVGLVAINAENTKKAYGAIKDEFKDAGIPIPSIKKPLVTLIDTFKNAHKPIGKYLFSDMGATLMNIDSEIMNNILLRLTSKDIPALSVYDSVVVPEVHADYLREVMVQEYQAIMKYEPKF